MFTLPSVNATGSIATRSSSSVSDMKRCSPVCAPFTARPAKSARVMSAPSEPRSKIVACSAQPSPSTSQPTPAGYDRKAGRPVYKPASFSEMVNDAVKCVQDALNEGIVRMEVEFPPVPVKLDGYKGSSDVFIDSNVQLSLAAARQLAANGRKVHVLMPDQGEYDRAWKLFQNTLKVMGGSVTLGHLREQGGFSFSLEGLFGGFAPDPKPAGAAADTYIMINATCVELLNVREYVNKMAPQGSGKSVILWNLELDSLRGDMGLPAFPAKDMHYDFLSTFRPVFYLRPRDYSKSVTVAPFIVNYSGALFREYPGPWQVMLRQDNGAYACVAEDRTRYNLGEVKEELQVAMGLNTEAEGSAMQTLRRGLKTSTWWEDDYDVEKSHEWRL